MNTNSESYDLPSMTKRSNSSTAPYISKMRSLSASVSKRNKKIHSSSPAAAKAGKRPR